MAREKFYSEDVLIEKVQNGEFGWLDYVNHFSKEWKDEYERYCQITKEFCPPEYFNYLCAIFNY